jgi:hypothetical protein
VITKDQAALFDRLMRDGATVIEATGVVKLATELAAWEHELRDKGGRFAKGGGGGGRIPGMDVHPPGRAGYAPMTEEGIRLVPKSIPVTPSLSSQRARKTGRLPLGTPAAPLHPPRTDDELTSRVAAMVDARLADAMVKMTAESTSRIHAQAVSSMRLEDLKRRAEEEARLHHKTKHKAIVEIGITVGALVLAIVEGIVGLPGLTQVISAMAPPVAQAVVEWRKRL